MEKLTDTLHYLSCLKMEIIEQILILDKKDITLDTQNKYITYNILVKSIDYLIDYILEIDLSNFDENEIVKKIKYELKKYEKCFNTKFNELLDEKKYCEFSHLFESDVDFFRNEMELS